MRHIQYRLQRHLDPRPCCLQQHQPEDGGRGKGPQQHQQAAGHPVQQGPNHREGDIHHTVSNLGSESKLNV